MTSSLSRAIFSLFATLLLLPVLCWAADEDRPPNIIIYFADDMGYADLACMGHPYAKTPNLDKLASEGTRFMQHYVTGVTCCPSRTGLMTGRHCARFEKYPSGSGFGDRIAITELLKNHGYRTGHFGKWHIGPKASQVNGTYGIDEVKNGIQGEGYGRDDTLTAATIDFIKRNADAPFYINVWGHSTHYPVKPADPALREEFGDIDFKRDNFSKMIQEKFDNSISLDNNIKESMLNYVVDVYSVDKNMGLIMDTLNSLGIADNTIVVFSSDHGAAPVKLGGGKTDEFSRNMLGYAGPLRGGKHDQTDGGVRVPFIIRWPGKIEAGRVDEQSVTSFMDWLPTLCSIAGITELPDGIDGEDISDIWMQGPRDRKTTLYWRTSSNSKNTLISLRKANWKFHVGKSDPELYNLAEDPGEEHNVADQYPEVASELLADAKAFAASLPESYIKLGDKDKRRKDK